MSTSEPRRLRLDQLLVERGLAPSREKAQAYIMAGEVWRGTERLTKPALKLGTDAELEVRARSRDVGRGALKLRHALSVFSVPVAGRVAVDIGASTGGFTQVLLEAGATRVFAVDSGHGQLDRLLREDPRVTCLEQTNARHFTTGTVGGVGFDLVVADVSFISLRLVLPPVLGCIAESAPRADAVVLMKPQFEAGRQRVGRGGVVRDPEIHEELLRSFRQWVPLPRWNCVSDTPSPIEGAEGNREFLMWYRREE